jgi:hypothetical protein
MTDAVKDWRVELMEAHPRLFGVPAAGPEAAQGYPECGEGWRDLLDRACVRIEAALAGGGTFTAQQIKEKYGTLRFYWSGRLPGAAEAKVEEAIDLAEARSACTCEICGAEGRLYSRGGWLATACPEHAQGEPAPVRPGFENLVIVRKFDAGQLPIVSCRLYVRATDSFEQVDPSTLDLDEE